MGMRYVKWKGKKYLNAWEPQLFDTLFTMEEVKKAEARHDKWLAELKSGETTLETKFLWNTGRKW